jgi:hypothetical protein
VNVCECYRYHPQRPEYTPFKEKVQLLDIGAGNLPLSLEKNGLVVRASGKKCS